MSCDHRQPAERERHRDRAQERRAAEVGPDEHRAAAEPVDPRAGHEADEQRRQPSSSAAQDGDLDGAGAEDQDRDQRQRRSGVMSDPKIEIVAAVQTRTNAWLRQSGDANGLRMTPELYVGAVPAAVHPVAGRDHRSGPADDPAVHSARLGASESAHHPARRAPSTARDRPDHHDGVRTRTVFDTLSERLRKTLGTLTGRGRISEADVDAAMREVRLALLEADVNFKVVKDFIARVRERPSARTSSRA